MANPEHLEILKQGVEVWNKWRKQNTKDLLIENNKCYGGIEFCTIDSNGADLSEADLSRFNLAGANLFRADLSNANLQNANLTSAILREANLTNANLSNAMAINIDLSEANLFEAKLIKAWLTGARFLETNLKHADISEATMVGANLSGACLQGANLKGADLSGATLVQTDLSEAILNGCQIYGISAWDLKLKDAKQEGLIITRSSHGEPEITVDNLEVAQFVYLLLNNSKLRTVIDTMTGKAVLILGRFGERKVILNTIADELRKRDYLPIMFDFDRPLDKTLTETVLTLAGLSKFVIAVMSDPNSVPWEVANIKIFDIPIVPLIQEGQRVFPMFDDLKMKKCYIPPFSYKDTEHIKQLMESLLQTAEGKHQELRELKAK